MKVLVVYESQYGHTRQIADAIAKGVRERNMTGQRSTARVYSVRTAPLTVPDDVDVVILGAPLHAYTKPPSGELTHSSTMDRILDVQPGIRDWLDAAVIPASTRVIAFDTRMQRWSAGSGPGSAAEVLGQAGIPNVERGGTFWVRETMGPLPPGEAAKAAEWGRVLALG